MQNFFYYNPTKLMFGKGQVEAIKSELPSTAQKVLVTYGGGSVKKFGLLGKVIDVIQQTGAEVFEFGGIEPNPRVSTVRKAVEICKTEGIDFIVAIGGGSVIDCTKLISVASKYDGDAWDIVTNKFRPTECIGFGTVLTIAATGSEMNNGSVITNWETNEKYGWASPLVFPKFSILDPVNTFTVPRNQTIFGIVDIMAHVFEQYFHHVPNTKVQDAHCEALLRTVIETAPLLLEDLESYEHRETILYSGTLALNRSLSSGVIGDWASHNIEHAISAVYDIPHGAGLAIVFPNWMKHVMNENVSRFKQFAINVYGVDPVGKTDEEVALEGIEANSEFWKSIGAPSQLAYYDIIESDVEKMVEVSMALGDFGNFKKLNVKDVDSILRLAL